MQSTTDRPPACSIATGCSRWPRAWAERAPQLVTLGNGLWTPVVLMNSTSPSHRISIYFSYILRPSLEGRALHSQECFLPARGDVNLRCTRERYIPKIRPARSPRKPAELGNE